MEDSDKMLNNVVEINFKLTRASDAFYLLHSSDDNKVRIKNSDATLFITQVELKTPLLLAHANAFGMKRNSHYPLAYTKIISFTASSRAQQVSIHNAFFIQIPKRILIALVKNTTLVLQVKNPYHFQHYGITNLVFYVNCVLHPSESRTID